MYAPAFFAPADSARVVGDMYSVSLIATLPVLAAAVAVFCLRRSSAGTRTIVWRCSVAGLLAIVAGRFVPWQWMAWVLPELLARPLVALGTVQLDASPGIASPSDQASYSGTTRGLLVLYWSGVALILFRTLTARLWLVIVRQRAHELSGLRWRTQLRAAGAATSVATDTVRLLISQEISTPVTWGMWRPVILLPRIAQHWPADRLQAVIRHELAHIRARDAAARLATRIACALFWFHPGVWWMARRFEADAEQACDDRVLLSGVRASDYAEWLAASSGADRQLGAAMALARRGHLRSRLAAVTDTSRRIILPGRRAAVCAMVVTTAMVAPLATARLAPTRQVLTSLMQETRWESRAWAVVRLAQRTDSVDVARTAARHDPDPAVRAWARYALSRSASTPAAIPRS